VRGYIAASSWGRTWYEHMLENERVRLTMDKKLFPAEINDSMRAFTDFYSLYLIYGKSPGEMIGQHPEWKGLWYDAPDGQYGRPAAFYQQLQKLNLGKVWQEVDAPVLVLHGTADTIMSPSDSRAISDIVNRAYPGHATYADIQDADHLLAVHNKLEDHVAPTMMDWMRKQLGRH
jgi:pimeloyl-ACP methyl ester carboxylesterase